jgi:hypothetical protein
MVGKRYMQSKVEVPGPGQYNNTISNLAKNPSWRYIIFKLN